MTSVERRLRNPGRRVVGIDPGITGALAMFEGGRLAEVVDMPVNGSRVDGAELRDIFLDWLPDVVYLEDVHAMVKNGVVASFSLGYNTGVVTGVVHTLTIPLVRVSAQAWKRKAGLWGKPKDASRGLARELFP